MTAIVVTTTQIAPVFANKAEIFSGIVGTGLTVDYGEALYWDSNGLLVKSNAAAAGTAKFAGISLGTGGAGQAVDVLKKGHVYGYTISGLAYGAGAFLNDTAGVIGDAAGTVSVRIGSVVPLSDADKTKVLYVDADWLTML